MIKKNASRLLAVILLTVLISACSSLSKLGGNVITISILYGSEKEEWLEPLVAQFNEAHNKTASGATIEVVSTPMGSIESARMIVEGAAQPTVWSPASNVYVPVLEAEWRKEHVDDLITGDPNELVLSPVVIAMWKPMAEALGWPDEPIGWADISDLAISDDGWAAYGYPEWGSFKFGHTHPNYSNSGIVSIIAEAYAGADKQRGLSMDDLQSDHVRDFMAAVESSIIHYGSSTGFFATRLFERGPSYLSAAVMYENLVVAQQSKVLANDVQQIDAVAIYPKEGTFWSDHPYVILNAPWVTDEMKEAAGLFEDFLLDRPQQESAIALGFRPADRGIALTSPLDAQHGVDPQQPYTVLEVPSADVITGVQELWTQVKKPVDLVVVMDVSGSMAGDKIAAARVSLTQFIDLLYDRDRLEIITFGSDILAMTPLTGLGEKRTDITRRVSGIIEGGDTRLYDAIQQAYEDLAANGDPHHIRAVVVLSDGQDTASNISYRTILDEIQADSESGGNAVKLFTVAYGGDADTGVLAELAEVTGGRQYQGDPDNILEIYTAIATFF